MTKQLPTASGRIKSAKATQPGPVCKDLGPCLKDQIYTVELRMLRKKTVSLKKQVETLGRVLANRKDFERSIQKIVTRDFKRDLETKSISRGLQDLSNRVEEIARSKAIDKEIDGIGAVLVPSIEDPLEAAKGILDVSEEEYKKILDEIGG